MKSHINSNYTFYQKQYFFQNLLNKYLNIKSCYNPGVDITLISSFYVSYTYSHARLYDNDRISFAAIIKSDNNKLTATINVYVNDVHLLTIYVYGRIITRPIQYSMVWPCPLASCSPFITWKRTVECVFMSIERLGYEPSQLCELLLV